MTNLEWLKKMKKDDEDWYKADSTKTIREFTNEFRKTKALEIIAEELCLLREKPTVINNVNFPNK
jgi:hypothetical protein